MYDSFGNIVLSTGSSTNWFRYLGQSGYYFDADWPGYYLRTRYYSAAFARFVSRDPSMIRSYIGIETYSSYNYCKNNPAVFADPSGLQVGDLLPPFPPPPSVPPQPPVRPPNFTINPLTWGYGRWCGLDRHGPGDWIDATDFACWKHDHCAANFWKAMCNWNKCTEDLCKDATLAYDKLCDWKYPLGSPGGNDCKKAATHILALFCSGWSQFLLIA